MATSMPTELQSNSLNLHVEIGEVVTVGDVLADIRCDTSSPNLDVFNSVEKDLFAEHARRGWNASVEARCDFKPCVRMNRRSGLYFAALWQKSIYGRTLTEIKADDAMVEFFAVPLARLIADVLGHYLSAEEFALCTTPKRRHKERNFATRITLRIAELLKLPFFEDVALAHNRQRVNAVFSLNILPPQRNIIVVDDFVTTGQTLAGMKNLLESYGKNLTFFAGINNKL